MVTGWRSYFSMCPDYWIRLTDALADGPLVLAAGMAGGTLRATSWQTPAAFKALIQERQSGRSGESSPTTNRSTRSWHGSRPTRGTRRYGFTLESVAPTQKTGELALIERIRARAQSRSPRVLKGIGDDCAILRPPPGHDLLVTTDFSRGRPPLPARLAFGRVDWAQDACAGFERPGVDGRNPAGGVPVTGIAEEAGAKLALCG